MRRPPVHRLGIMLIAALAAAAPSMSRAQTAPIPVEVTKVQAADVPLTVQGIGTVQAFNTVTVRAQVTGVLQQVRFTEGQAVKAGDVLAQIDPRPFKAALDQAVAKKAQDEAQLQNARLDLQRFLGIGEFASRQTDDTQRTLVDQLQAQVQGDQATIDNAQVQLGYTTLASPVDGITGIRLMDQGNLILAPNATPIVVVTQIRPISVIFSLPSENLVEVRQAMAKGGAPLRVTVQERPSGRPLGEGTLLLMNNQIDSTTGQLQLKATLPNENGLLWPGQFVTVQLLVRVDHDVPTVPSTAIQRGPDGYWVYVVKPDQTVAAQPVRVSRMTSTAVLEGGTLPPGTMVVSGGQYRLTPGARITV
ncbi:MAG TPA: efflux RND transporter periplasmic adaptor subunit, partial [Crenalkalicoccus sp.]|nr:efflux RND transporter periplasmic adaptor subunit [Crenalkalicoccus sp.]